MGVGDKGRDNLGEANPRGRGTMAVASLRAGNYIKSHLTFSCPLIARYYSFTARFYCPATIVLIGLFRSPTGGCGGQETKRRTRYRIRSPPARVPEKLPWYPIPSRGLRICPSGYCVQAIRK